MRFEDLASLMIERCASDVFVKTDGYVRFRVASKVVQSDIMLNEDQVNGMVDTLIDVKGRSVLEEKGSTHFAVNFTNTYRLRVIIFYQQGKFSIVARSIKLHVPELKDLGLPHKIMEALASERRGMIILTGTTGSGKSTSIAAMIEYMNKHMQRHILTIEEPVEFTFEDKQCIINQREVGKDVPTYSDALVQFTLQSPDVIYIGTIWDTHTCRAALSAAETGTLVITTLHTVDAPQSVERLLNFFPPHQQAEISVQLASLLKGVISLRLVPKKAEQSLVPAYEVMTLSPTVSRLIRERKIWEIPNYLDEGAIYGMVRFDTCLCNLVKEGAIAAKTAIDFSDHKEELSMKLSQQGLL